MDNPVKLIYKYKNLNKRVNYEIFIFLGTFLDDNVKKILRKIENLSFYDSLIELSIKEVDILKKIYGEKWYLKFFILDHLELSFNLIEKTETKKKEIIKKYTSKWLEDNIDVFSGYDKSMYSFQYLYNKERELRLKAKKFREKKFRNRNLFQQIGGNDQDDYENYEENKDDDDNDDLETTQILDKNSTFDDVDEFDIDELKDMYKEVDIDENISNTSKMIDQIMKDDEKNITSKNKLIKFPNTNNSNIYDGSLKNSFKKNYIFENYLYQDDTIKKIKEKICCSIEMNEIFTTSGNLKHKAYLTPSRLYMWSKYTYTDISDNTRKDAQIMIGQKWIKKNQILDVDVEPLDNLKKYEELRGNIENIKQDMKKHGSRIRREEDENQLLEYYNQPGREYIRNNEIYITDIFHSIGLNYDGNNEKIKNLYDIYVKIYYSHINTEDFKQILNYLNVENEENRKYEINYMKNIYQTINNDLIIENEITKIIETYTQNINIKSNITTFYDNYITHAVINTYLGHENTFNSSNLDLYRIFDNFDMNSDFPFLNYQLIDGKMVYKYYTVDMEKDREEIKSRWFETIPFGISFKIKVNLKKFASTKYIAVSLTETGRLEYKVQFKEEDKATTEDIKESFIYIKKLLLKINNENDKLKIMLPDDSKFEYAFINSIQKFQFNNKNTLNHNDLSEFSRYFYPYIAVVIEPRKRDSKNRMKVNKSKYGTYLRYKRVDKYENEAKVEHRILYFMKNYEFTDLSLIKEIAKQFNITESIASEQINKVREKFPIIKKSRKVLKKIESAPKYNHPGIGVDIQGKSRLNYKIRIAGSRTKSQLERITKFMNVLIYLYIEVYINKSKIMNNLKNKLVSLSNIAKRRNKVDDIVDIGDAIIKDVKKLTNFDSERLGYRPEEGASHWTRSCQNSGKKKRQPKFFTNEALDKLLKKGYKYNEKTKYYEKKIKKGKKEIILRAADQENTKDKTNTIYYTCDPDDNNEYMYVGFLTKSKNPNDLCEPCCFKKDQLDSKNKEKKNYYLKCMRRISDVEIKKKTSKDLDKVYILQDTNKIQQDRFGLLPKNLDFFLNKNLNNSAVIKNHYLISTNKTYIFKYGVKISNIPFLEAIASIYDLSLDDVNNILYKSLENDKNDILFNSLNSGDIRIQFRTREKFINFLKINKVIDHVLLMNFISIPGIISKNGINFYIFEKKTEVIKLNFEKKQIKDDFNLICSLYEDDIYRKNKNYDNLLILKDNKTYYPIFELEKQNNKKVKVKKVFGYEKIIEICLEFYNIGCNNITNLKFNPGLNYSLKIINNKLNNLNKDYQIKHQYIDIRNKCRYAILNNNYLIPLYPSGSLYNINILPDISKYIISLDRTIKYILDFNSKIDIDYLPIGLLYTDKKKNKYKVVGFLLNNDIELKVLADYYDEVKILNIAKIFKRNNFLKKNIINEDIIDNFITKNTFEYDDRIIEVKKNEYKKESYELFRLEMRNYLNMNLNIKDKIIKILENKKLSIINKKDLLQSVILKLIDTELYKLDQTGGNKIGILDDDYDVDFKNYTLRNKRDICSSNINKELCNSNVNCKWKSNTCNFILNTKDAISYSKKIINELIHDDMKSNEILSLNNYYVDEIVNYDEFSRKENENIITSNIPNMEKVLSNIFGEDNLPTIGKNKFYIYGKSIEDENQENLIESIGNLYLQNIIENNNTIIRAYCNSYYWLSNPLLNIKAKNLNYYSDLQTNLTNYFIGNIIDFISDPGNKEYIYTALNKYIVMSIDDYIQQLGVKSSIIQNGIIELTILSKIYNQVIVILNNYFDIIYVIKEGNIIYDNKYYKEDISKYKQDKILQKCIVILYEYLFGSNKISSIKSVYY